MRNAQTHARVVQVNEEMRKVLETIESGVVAVGPRGRDHALQSRGGAAHRDVGPGGAGPVARVPAQPARERAPRHRRRWRAAVSDRVLAARRGRPDGAPHVLHVAAARARRGAAGRGRGAGRHVAAQGAGAGEAAGGAPGLDRGDRVGTDPRDPQSPRRDQDLRAAPALAWRERGVPGDVLAVGGPGDRAHRRSAEPLPHDVAGLAASHGDGGPLGPPARHAGSAPRRARGPQDPAPPGRRADATAGARQRLTVTAAFSEPVLKCTSRRWNPVAS